MIGSELKEVFKEAIRYAKFHQHEYLTTEHIFWSIIDSDEGWAILSVLNAKPDELTKNIEKYIKDNIISLEEAKDPIETITLTETVNSMLSNINSSGREQAMIGDMLVSIIEREDTYSRYLLKKSGIDRIDILEVISHEMNNDDFDDDNNTSEDSVLSQFTNELVELSKKGKIDPVIGRELEVNRVMQTLCRRKKIIHY